MQGMQGVSAEQSISLLSFRKPPGGLRGESSSYDAPNSGGAARRRRAFRNPTASSSSSISSGDNPIRQPPPKNASQSVLLRIERINNGQETPYRSPYR